MMKQTRRITLDKAGAQEAVKDYMSSLADLTVNSKPHINALTFLAEDYLNYAAAIVNAVDDHLQKVPSNVKLPILYLIDSIIKNVGKDYIALFSSTMVHSFCTVFKQVDEKTRHQMYKLRLTWNEIYSQEDLYAMDVGVNTLDPNWPITAAPAQSGPHKIHINPKFLQTSTTTPPTTAATPDADGSISPVTTPKLSPAEVPKPNETVSQAAPPPKAAVDVATEVALREQLLQRKRDLLQLQQEKVDLELSQMKAKLDKKQKAVSKLNDKTQENVPAAAATTKENATSLMAPYNIEDDIVMVKEVRVTPWGDGKKVTQLALHQKDSALSMTDSSSISVPSSAPKIAPVSSGLINLIASQRAQRDPRLSKQKEDITRDESSKKQTRSRDPRLGSKPEKRSRSSEKESSKSGRHRSRDVSSDRSSSRHSSRREDREKRPSETRKSSRKSEDRTTSRAKKTRSRSPSKSSSKRERRDSNRSPRKSSYTSHRPVSDTVDSPESDSSDSKDRAGSPTSPRSGSASASGSSSWPVNYTKGSHKGRNYVRKNQLEESPEVISTSVSSDVDLRLSAPPPEKQPRLTNPSERVHQSSSSALSPGVPEQTVIPKVLHGMSTVLPTIACQDVDLRCLPSPGKKRRSAEPEDGPPPNKKNKAAYMEMLFGKQDVDLRQMDMKNGVSVEAPSPPPPPIISSHEGQTLLKDDSLGWSEFKQTLTPSPSVERSPAFPKSSRHERLGRSSGENEDTDMRPPINGLESSAKPDYPAILARAAEQVKNGTLSQEDYGRVQKQLFHMHESEKIREAQRKDYTRRDEWERRPREKDYRHGMRSPENEQFGDIDDRYPVPASRPTKKPLLPLPMVPPVHPDGNRLSRHMGHHVPGSGSMQGPGYMRPQRPILGNGPRGHLRTTWHASRSGPGYKDIPLSLPSADSFILEKIAQDSMRIIDIDGVGREIRFYGADAVAILAPDNPCEILFDPGDASVIINEVLVHCSFHGPTKEVNIGGKMYRVRLGAPTRELYVNDEGFDCQFNCPPKEIHLDSGEVFLVQLQTDTPPKVHVGNTRRDLVAGRVMLVIDAENAIPIFLDAKPQRFDIDGVPHIIKFADALQTVLINGRPVNIQFGGHPVPISVSNRRHYIRLTELPPGVVPGEAEIVSMSHFRTQAPSTPSTTSNTSSRSGVGTPWAGPSKVPQFAQTVEMDHEPALPMHEPALPVRGGLGVLTRGMPKKIMKPRLPRRDREPTEMMKPARMEDRQMPAELLQAIQPGLPSLFGLLPSSNNSGYSCTPSVSGAYGMRQGVGTGSGSSTTSMLTHGTNSSASTPATASAADPSTTSSSSNGVPLLLAPELDIKKLFQSLYDTGIISAISSINDKRKDKAKEEEESKKKVHEVDFKEASSSFKVKQPALIDMLYSGIQCSSCGTRFPPEQTEKYSSHLDWHFRQNRRDKDSARKPQSRKWYYDVTDWIQFEEIDETVDKTQNWFDTQQSDAAKFEEAEEEEIQSVPSNDFPDGTVCELCHDKFDQFYNEDKEEWHLKDCLVADGLPYHPICYKDYRVSLESNDESDAPTDSVDPTEPAAPSEPTEPSAPTEPSDLEVPVQPAVPSEPKAEPSEAKVEPSEAKAEPSEAKAEPSEAKAEPSEPKAEPTELAAAPSEPEVTVASSEPVASTDTTALAVPAADGTNDVESIIKEPNISENEQESAEDSSEVNAKVKMETDAEDLGGEKKEEEKEQSEHGVIIKQEVVKDVSDGNLEKGSEGNEEEAMGERLITIKQEVIDEDPEEDKETSELMSLEEPPMNIPMMNTNSAVVSCSIDGNLELTQAPTAMSTIPKRIKINISKPIIAKPYEESEDDSDNASENGDQEEPAPPGEETIVLKPMLVGRKLCELPPRVRGTETSGLCSIM